MIRPDARARRVAIVADFLVNPEAAFYDTIEGRPGPLLDVLVEDGWGLMIAPSHLLGEATAKATVATIAGDATDYAKHGYLVAILAAEGLPRSGLWLDLFEAAFRDLGAAMPPVIGIDARGARGASALRQRLPAGSPDGAPRPAPVQ